MRFESKHQYFKDVIDSVNNVINVTHSLTTRHQRSKVHYLLDHHYFHKLEKSNPQKLNSQSTNIFMIKFPDKDWELYKSYNWVTVKGVKDVLFLKTLNSVSQFVFIQSIIMYSTQVFF